MLTLEAAGALLLVLLGACALLFTGCLALIYARTKLVPHADCRRFNAALALEVQDLADKWKHRGKVAGGQASRAKKPGPAAEVEEEPEVKAPGGGAEFEAVATQLAQRRGFN